jgi:hypothetical protein
MSRTTLINGSLSHRNMGVGDGLLNSIVILINGVETLQVAPSLKYSSMENDFGLALSVWR